MERALADVDLGSVVVLLWCQLRDGPVVRLLTIFLKKVTRAGATILRLKCLSRWIFIIKLATIIVEFIFDVVFLARVVHVDVEI